MAGHARWHQVREPEAAKEPQQKRVRVESEPVLQPDGMPDAMDVGNFSIMTNERGQHTILAETSESRGGAPSYKPGKRPLHRKSSTTEAEPVGFDEPRVFRSDHGFAFISSPSQAAASEATWCSYFFKPEA